MVGKREGPLSRGVNGFLEGETHSISNGREKILGLVGSVPHFTTIADGSWHGVVNDDVGRNVQVGDA